jgi:hypothetical protein
MEPINEKSQPGPRVHLVDPELQSLALLGLGDHLVDIRTMSGHQSLSIEGRPTKYSVTAAGYQLHDASFAPRYTSLLDAAAVHVRVDRTTALVLARRFGPEVGVDPDDSAGVAADRPRPARRCDPGIGGGRGGSDGRAFLLRRDPRRRPRGELPLSADSRSDVQRPGRLVRSSRAEVAGRRLPGARHQGAAQWHDVGGGGDRPARSPRSAGRRGHADLARPRDRNRQVKNDDSGGQR